MPPRTTGSATATRTRRARSGTSTRALSAAVRPTGQLIWAGAPPGGKSFELFESASGQWQMYLLINNGGTISRSLIKPNSPELMIMFQTYLAQHPPIRLANRSVARTAANAVPAIEVGPSIGQVSNS